MKGEKQNMNKFITKLAKLFLGISMAAGVGVAIGTNSRLALRTNADETTNIFSNGSFSNNTITWTVANVITVKQEKNTGSTAPNSSYVSSPRWYSGNKVTFTPSSGVTITKFVITAGSNSYASTLAGSNWSQGTAAASSTEVTWTGSQTSAFNVVLTGQSRLSSMIVTYTSGGGGGGGDTPVEGDFNLSFGTNLVKIDGQNINATDSYSNAWNIVTAGTTSFTQNAAYSQVGSSSKPATSITFTGTLSTTSTKYSVSALSIKMGGFSGTAGTVTLKVGDTAASATSVGTGSLNATSDVTITNSSSGKGKVIVITVTSISKGVKVYGINYTYSEAKYTVSFGVNTAGYGTVSQPSITNISSGTSITENGNQITIGSTTVTATPTSSGAQYMYAFNGWTKSPNNSTVTDNMTITANFTRTTNTYTVTWKNWDNSTIKTDSGVAYGTTPSYSGSTPTKAATDEYSYAFTGWSPTPAAITGNTTYTAQYSQTKNTFTVSGSIEHGDLDDTSSIEYGGNLDVNIEPATGYTLPASVSVTMGGEDITEDVEYSDGNITYSPVTGNIVITASCPASGQTYSISTTATNGTYSGDTTITDNGGTASVTISPVGDYKLPTSVSVSGADHTYNSTTGVISLSNASGDVTINASMVALTEYSITVNETNGSHTGSSTIKESRSASLTFTPSSGYGQPESVSVSGATSSWNSGTGVLSLSNPSGNVTVTYVAAENELDFISISTNSGNYTLGDDFVKPTVTAHYTVSADANVTNSPNLDILGYDPYTTGSQTVTIKYTEGEIYKTAAYTAIVSALPEKETTTTWTKVTSTSSLSAGDEVVIVSDYTNNALSTTQNTNNRGVAAVTKSGDNITWTGESVQVLTLVDTSGVTNAPAGSYGLSPSSGNYLYAGSSTSNHLKTQSALNLDACFVISFSSGIATINATGSSNRHLMQYNNGSTLFSCYSGTQTNGDLLLYKKYVETSGDDPSLIRITAEYSGGDKNVGDSISASDFSVKKQLNNSNSLVDVASGWTIDASTLSSTSNNITVSYTEGGITKSAVVTVSATERQATLDSVTLVVGENAKLDGYIAWSGAEWDLSDICVVYDWSDDQYDDEVDLEDLVQAGDATIYPVSPTINATSFTVTYSYLDVDLDANVVTLDNAVRADYVKSISWTGTTESHFKAFSGSQLTAAQVGAWHVIPTYEGAGAGSELAFNEYTLKVGNKPISSLPYTWTSEDDGQELSITYGLDKNGDDFVKKNGTAVADICASINAIDHEETTTGEQTLSFIDTSSASWIVTEAGVSGGDANGGSPLDISNAGFNIVSNNGYWTGSQIRSYKNSTFTISSSYTIKSLSFTFNGDNTGGLETSYTNINATSKTFEELGSQARFTSITIVFEGSVTGTVHYANQMEHFDAQKKVVEFAKFMNTTMNGTNVCSGTFANLESAWGDVAGKYDELFGASTTLNETELAWAKNMLKYADATWGSDAEAACVEKAMKTYEHCVSHYDLDEFMSTVRSAQSVKVSPLVNIIGENTNIVAIIVIISMVSVTAIGGYFFLRKRKENN